MAVIRARRRASPRTALTVYADENLLDLDLALIFARVPNLLKIDTRIGGLKVLGAPRISLRAEAGLPPITIVVPLEVRLLWSTHQVKVSIEGWLSVVDGVACVGNLDIDVDTSHDLEEKLLNDLIDRLLQGVTQGTKHMELPTLHAVFGRELDARLLDVGVVELHGRPMLMMTATVGPGDNTLPPTPLPADMHLEWPDEGEGTLIALVPEHFINALLMALIGNFRHVIKTRLGPKAARVRLKGKIEVESPQVDFRRDELEAGINVRFRGMRGGLELFGDTNWSDLDIKRVRAEIDIGLETTADGRQATLKVNDVDGIKPKFKNGRDIDDQAFEQLVRTAAGAFNRALRDRLVGHEMRIFDVPAAPLSSSEPMRVRPGPHGLALFPGTLVADLRFSSDTVKPDTSGIWDRQNVRGVSTYIRERGRGQPLVFIPDIGQDVECWQRQFDHFAHDYRVIAYECRGQGRTEASWFPFGMGALVRDLRKLMEEREIDRPVLCGQGLGALVALHFAAHNPGKAAGVVVVASAGGLLAPALKVGLFRNAGGPSSGGSFRERFFSRRLPHAEKRFWSPDPDDTDTQALAMWRRRFLRGSILGALHISRAAGRVPSEGRLRRVKTPVLTVRNDNDRSDPRVLDLLRAEDVRLRVQSLMPMIEHHRAFNQAIEAFVERVAFGQPALPAPDSSDASGS